MNVLGEVDVSAKMRAQRAMSSATDVPPATRLTVLTAKTISSAARHLGVSLRSQRVAPSRRNLEALAVLPDSRQRLPRTQSHSTQHVPDASMCGNLIIIGGVVGLAVRLAVQHIREAIT